MATKLNIINSRSFFSLEAFKSFYALTKPRVCALIVFTAIIGMFLATPGMVPLDILFFSSIGIAFVSGAAAAFNCLIEEKIDAKMARTRGRPLPLGQVSQKETVIFSVLLGGFGLLILYFFVNSLTMWLTLATFFAYAVIYTIFLKPATPMNIVIGGASGAMPPLLGWAAVTNQVTPEALILFLIIFCWTPPHFWALALYRRKEYEKVGMPMLPVTHGEKYTRLQIVLYTIILVIVTMMPFSVGMSGLIYIIFATLLNAYFLYYTVMLYRQYSDKLSMKIFRYSIWYLGLIFLAFLVDHYFKFKFI
ncbi:MAG: heme o synthase [Proteobacteria bacterium]|jgi:heme o synthase|nr:heme o synthase [Pseudomonadota bacterium]MDA0942020.1 heme o synthase [Pseudomonadota bacterium]MDA1034108.1 heme o synthase [Pseudomonadota bacterium]